MNHIWRWAIVCGFLAMNISGPSFADVRLDKSALETLIKGNTVEGRNIKWKTTYRMYFDPTGRFWRIDSRYNKEKGEWHVEKNGTLRMSGRKVNYRKVKQRSGGGYDVYGDRGTVIWTIDKVTPGNPYHLGPNF
ncbi:MAG: hypothetical protein P8012_08615 [Desulfobacterales bacterium]